ncbi:MAG: pyridoxamine 5'-phosphate oxidase family protein [Chloroflexi bacterium]|nr:pyridoxamine 5'-phosphate oxidase family protein [Chloroflexota bacterium]
MPDTLRDRIAKFLAVHTTMTLATVGPDGAPQAAAVFYAPDDRLNLYFLSEPDSRHARNLSLDPRVAATIHADGQDWRSITGLQIEGTAEQVKDARELAHATRTYAARFDFVAGLLTGAGEGPATLVGPLARSRLYVLRPRWIRLIDNRVRFGHKEEWRVSE